MAGMPVLRISDEPTADGQRRVEVTWQDGPARQKTVSTFAYQAGAQDTEKVRWYLEDYAEFPADPAPRLARDAEAILTDTGTSLFNRVFDSRDAAKIWAHAEARLSQVRVEVDADPTEAPGLPWELLRDPGSDTALALGAGEFVRTHLETASRVALPQAAGDQLRVLLVICRPGGREDVPFRSVASRLVRSGAEQMPGLELDVLRPATFPYLADVLHRAADAGHPYHVVHFDGHGAYLDLTQFADDTGDDSDAADSGQPPVSDTASGGGGNGGVGVSPLRYGISVAGPVRAGQHGYLIFENPGRPAVQQFVDGPALGRLLTATGVPVLVLNACRSAYSEAPASPGQPADPTEQPGSGTQSSESSAADADELAADVHARIRAYGSLAAEVADAGVPGVVAMRYNVYVVTAAQYMADLYAHLVAGKSLGHAATAARRALAASPTRQITTMPVDLQDWAVPVIYEAAPLTLLRPEQQDAPLIKLSTADGAGSVGDAGGIPGPPDAGFFGRDETLLALDRAFDAQQIVLLHAYAGAGKSSTVAEFARWYRATGGLDHPAVGAGPVLWSSFEHHLPLDRLLDTAGDAFAGLLEANRIQWQAITDPAVRKDLVLQVLAQVPALWVWDNIEPVTGFPLGTTSPWTQAEQDSLLGFLRDLSTKTQCKVLLTSRRDERIWLGDIPARLKLPPMPMRERLQLAAALTAQRHQADPGIDWRPLLRYTAGNPLTITVLVGQALRDGLATTAQIEAFVTRLRAGEAGLETGEDAALGRTRSLAASLAYGFSHAFTEAERSQLAVLHLFRDTIDADALRVMGEQDFAGDDAVAQLAGITRETAIALLDRAAAIGLLASIGGGYYTIHPALPWYFTTLFTDTYGSPGDPTAQQATRAYTHTLAGLGRYYFGQSADGTGDPIPALREEEGNLLHALDLARATQHWDDALGCLQGLNLLYLQTGRDGEWARLVDQITPDFIDPDTGGPLPGRDDHWNVATSYRVRLAMDARDWPAATRLQHTLITWNRDQAATAMATPSDQLTPRQRNEIRSLGVSLEHLGHILRFQEDPGCLPYYQEALDLYQRIGARTDEANMAVTLGNAYLHVPELRDLDQAERWYRHSLALRTSQDKHRQAISIGQLAHVAYERFMESQTAGEPEQVLLGHLNAALDGYQQALAMASPDDHESLAIRHNQLGNAYQLAGDTRQALQHYQQSITHEEARGNTYGAGQTRYNIALVLEEDGRPGDALLYARAALHDYEKIGPGAAQKVVKTRALIAELEQARK